RPGGVGGRAGAGVAGRAADDRLGTALRGQAYRDRHAAVLERARRVGPLDLEVDVAPGLCRQGRRGQQRRAALLQRDHGRVLRHRKPVTELLDHAAPARGQLAAHSSSSASTRITLATLRTAVIADRLATVWARSSSRAVW